MKIAVKNFDNKELRQIDLPDSVFAYPYKEHLIHTAVQSYLASLRRGTHKTKTRAEVSGSGKKLWRQKGTGRARTGDIRNPKWRKGGIVWGPVPKDWSNRMTAGEKRNALKSALSQKAAEAKILVLENLDVDSHKTQALIKRLTGLGIAGKALLVDSHGNDKLALAARNNPAIKTVDALAVNVYDVVDRSFLVVSEDALNRLVEVLSK
jgi:large subunit ribosomal protein L4